MEIKPISFRIILIIFISIVSFSSIAYPSKSKPKKVRIDNSKINKAIDTKAVMAMSRNATVEVMIPGGKGTGFFIGSNHIATCFHVVGNFDVNNGTLTWRSFTDVQVKTVNGQVLDASVVSFPAPSDLSPLQFDFAILKLKQPLASPPATLAFTQSTGQLEVGDEVIFSGHPLDVNGMITHKGMVSGFSSPYEFIFVQSSINKGNSGGALCNSKGEVVGIVSRREGRVNPPELEKAMSAVNIINAQDVNPTGTVKGVDLLKEISNLASTLDKYISTGIGYANQISHIQDYVSAHPELKE